ncbi:GTP diphosphokinase [Permianibacter aggregans]|uniref:GTP pyrophosphokinase n=1 Tax=Permianibacter aggregans TaxID=1510150 RepID=A0A4R6UTY1_9GAMM|nr:GTP diphosphokinase [Permianibacter aggregans]QGX38825.1 GTP diphosphokinase [Permianibacter aggregans]TDQ50631.1 GTP pyrophosphokinase [Permianibacter aggregans]
MVKVREDFPLTGDGAIDIDRWLSRINIQREPEQMNLLCKAIELVITQHWDCVTDLGLSCFEQGLAVAEILASLNLDTNTLTAAVISPSVQFGELSLEHVEELLSKPVAELVAGALRMEAIRSLQDSKNDGKLTASQGDNLRKMLIAMVDDTRIVLLKLAERIYLLRAIKDKPRDVQLHVASETREIFAPLANRLGIGQLKWELEDLSFRYLNASEYKEIASHLHEKRLDREQYIKRVIQTLESELQKAGINGEVSGRVKHIYSIWRKMTRKGVGFEEIYDVRAVRILVPEIRDCYAALGIVHSCWQHIPKEFDDYIATPKENGYRSLHTAVIGPEGKALEVQIRTHQMHQESELGVAAHWRYKEGAGVTAPSTQDSKIAWLRQLVEWQEEVADSNALLDEFRHEVVDDRVYVFTPDGNIIDLPAGATPVDFAYHVHTSVGHRCRGAKVNGRIVPLTYQLQTGEQVQILTAKEGKPSLDWLSPHLGYVHSHRARSKIQNFFRQQNREQNVQEGKENFERELSRHGLSKVDLLPIAQRFNLHSVDDLYGNIGAGDIGLVQATNAALALYLPKQEESESLAPVLRSTTSPEKVGGISVLGVDNLLTHTAGCCRPVPGDQVIGYITQGRGISIHRADCAHIQRAHEERPERLVEIDWSADKASLYVVDLLIEATDRQGLLRDVTTLVANERINVSGMSTTTNKKTQISILGLQVEVRDALSLSRLVAQLAKLPGVMSVQRRSDG